MVNSMTAFASASGGLGGLTWAWEIRSVNGRGLDLRVRLPEGLDGLEPDIRKAIGRVARRGSVTVGLRLRRSEDAGGAELNRTALAAALSAVQAAAEATRAEGLETAPLDPARLLALPGVYSPGERDRDLSEATRKALRTDLDAATAAFADARAAEGAALKDIIDGQVSRISDLVAEARTALGPRATRAREAFMAALARVTENVDPVDEVRLHQELSLIAVKSDVAEEIDRLETHIAAARDLLAARDAMGRKFDFLTQEFNREANTLCSKSNDPALTRVGLELKAVIDQMREQVQNVE